jgi:hypothetical protein
LVESTELAENKIHFEVNDHNPTNFARSEVIEAVLDVDKSPEKVIGAEVKLPEQTNSETTTALPANPNWSSNAKADRMVVQRSIIEVCEKRKPDEPVYDLTQNIFDKNPSITYEIIEKGPVSMSGSIETFSSEITDESVLGLNIVKSLKQRFNKKDDPIERVSSLTCRNLSKNVGKPVEQQPCQSTKPAKVSIMDETS